MIDPGRVASLDRAFTPTRIALAAINAEILTRGHCRTVQLDLADCGVDAYSASIIAGHIGPGGIEPGPRCPLRFTALELWQVAGLDGTVILLRLDAP